VSPSDLALVVVRAVHLLGLALLPRFLTPEPLPPAHLALAAAGSVLLLAAVVGAGLGYRRFMETRDATAAAVLAGLAVVAALGCSLAFRGPSAPLAHGVPIVAIPAWGALASAASAAGARWLGSSFKHKRMSAATAVLAIGVKLLLDAAPLLGSDARMWRAAMRRAPDHERAVTEVGRALLGEERLDEARRLAERCLAARPTACACLALRADVAARAAEPEPIAKGTREAADRCGHAE
jgi:hypothetical protein